VVLNILTQDASGDDAQEDDAARFRDRYDLTWHVLADPDGAWMAEWGANGGSSQHSYAVVDGDGVITWRRADGGGTTVTEVNAAVEASER
jgi:peroxiredoxin